MMKNYRPLLSITSMLVVTAMLAGCGGPEPTPQQVKKALGSQMSDAGISCQLLRYKNVKVDSRRKLAENVRLLHVSMDVKFSGDSLGKDERGKCKKLLNGNSPISLKTKMAYVLLLAKFGFDTNNLKEGEVKRVSDQAVKLIKTDHGWHVMQQ